MASLKLALVTDANNPIVGDLYLENGTVRLTQTLSEEVAQLLWTRLRSFLGGWFLDTSIGFPWMQSVLGQKTPLSILQQMFRYVLLTCPGVATLTKFNLTRTVNRGLSLTFAATLQDGTTLTESAFGPLIVPRNGA